MRPFRHSSRNQCYSLLIAIIVFALSSQARADEAIPDAQESHPGLAQESRFAEAVIAYNKKQTEKSLQILDELIKVAPTRREYLEMEALALKGTGNTKKSVEVYQKLYQVSPEAEKGPYAFELGTLFFQAGKQNEAKTYFEKSVQLKFNVAAARFYLGLGDYQQSNYASAEKNFAGAADADIQPYSVMSKYYLGISYFKLSNGPQGVQELVDVRRETKDAQTGDVTKTIHDATEKMLEPFNHGQWFGNFLLQSQYDSNVQQLPAGFANPNSGNNPATAKMNLSLGGGYMTAPLDTIQWVAGYRASYNYDFNQQTKGFEYFTNNASLYANYNALARTSGGVKLEGTFAFQNSLEDPTNSQSGYEYQKYNFLMGGGPYFHHQLSREWKMEAEAEIRKQTFYADPELSGNDYNGRISFRSDYGRTYFNPGASVLYENDRTDSEQFFYDSYGIGVLNTMNFPGAITVVETIDLVFAHYSQALPTRDDKNYAFKVSGIKLVTAKFSVLADIGYVKNASNLTDVYSYNQFVTSLGIGYTF